MSIGNCPRCGGANDDENAYCYQCRIRELANRLDHDQDWKDYDEPMIYECAMCGAEMVSFETIRGNKFCYSCASIERYG